MLRIPQNRDEIFDKLASDVESNLPTTNPQKEKSWLRSILVSFAGAFYDLYFQLLEAIDTFFTDTTYGIYLERKASNNGIFRNPATISIGNISFTGIVTTSIPANTILNGVSNSIQYKTLTTKSITDENLAITLMTYDSGLVTVVTTNDHDLVLGINIIISGATPAGLNGTYQISSIINSKTFQYQTNIVGSGTATGTIIVGVTRAIIDIKSETAGDITNLNVNEQLTLLSPIVGIDNTAKVTFDGIGGGANVESDERLRSRLKFKLQNPVTLFNAVQIELLAKELSFVDRVFVFEITPDVGQVTIYILKENNVIPNASELQQITDKIEETILPVNTAIADVFVLAPTPIIVNFVFSSITPNTETMKTSITNKLIEFFNNQTSVGIDITENQYNCAIQSTIDLDTGEILQDFTLISPTGDITITGGEIGVLGGVSFV
jgi:uncharacterized phage protein gp47/JayE